MTETQIKTKADLVASKLNLRAIIIPKGTITFKKTTINFTKEVANDWQSRVNMFFEFDDLKNEFVISERGAVFINKEFDYYLPEIKISSGIILKELSELPHTLKGVGFGASRS